MYVTRVNERKFAGSSSILEAAPLKENGKYDLAPGNQLGNLPGAKSILLAILTRFKASFLFIYVCNPSQRTEIRWVFFYSRSRFYLHPVSSHKCHTPP